MDKMVGPMGFTEEDPEGFLFEGFQHPPNLATYYNFPFMNGFLEHLGYVKEVDYVSTRCRWPRPSRSSMRERTSGCCEERTLR